MRKNEEDQGARLVRVMIRVLLGGVIGLFVCFVLFMICSVGISTGILKENLMYKLTVIGCVLGGFAGGLSAVSRCRSRTLIVGLATGGVLFLLLLTVGLLFFESMTPEKGGLGLLCGALCGGTVAGILGGKPKKKRK